MPSRREKTLILYCRTDSPERGDGEPLEPEEELEYARFFRRAAEERFGKLHVLSMKVHARAFLAAWRFEELRGGTLLEGVLRELTKLSTDLGTWCRERKLTTSDLVAGIDIGPVLVADDLPDRILGEAVNAASSFCDAAHSGGFGVLLAAELVKHLSPALGDEATLLEVRATTTTRPKRCVAYLSMRREPYLP
jgi:hypothetical protein